MAAIVSIHFISKIPSIFNFKTPYKHFFYKNELQYH
nr:MAG TPA: hypothetical protein [Caudoviricetes sp.]